MGCHCSYKLSITGPGASFVSDKVIERLRADCHSAQNYLNEIGDSTGNEGPWRDIEDDMRAFSQEHPVFLFRIDEEVDEEVDYETTQYARYWFKAGKSISHAPVMTWPEFDESELR